MIRRVALAVVLILLGVGLTTGPAAARERPGAVDPLRVYTGTVDSTGLDRILALGVDRSELELTPSGSGSSVEVILTSGQAAELARAGVALLPKQSEANRRSAAAAPTVFRPYSGAGGLQEELLAQATSHPRIAQAVTIGKTVQGQEITAVRVTRNPQRAAQGARPATVYVGAQHAREWITPEMVRRLLDRIVDGYGTDAGITRLVNTTELWFIPVANPDGYDYTFTGDRLWRKNLADNNGDGVVAFSDGVDLNRNYPTRWKYDNEGSSPTPVSQTYRGPAPASEPETQALDGLFAKIRPQFLVNYHSAAELLLSGIGWQVATPSPDDVIYEAMSGDDADTAIPGYDPDLSAELYTTNGDTDSHMQEAYGTLGFTPEMTTCETASAISPDDQWEPEACESGFNFPDDEALVQQEFEKNVPFALAVARSAVDPDDPVSVVGRDTEDFRVDTFSVSYGDPQTVAVVAKRSLLFTRMQYRINGGPTRTVRVTEWAGGERYGSENTDYYAEYRGVVTGAKPGDSVDVWFVGIPSIEDVITQGIRLVRSDPFTYRLQQDTGHDVLIVADEDYDGVDPTYPAGTTAPKYLQAHVDALRANGVEPDVLDVDAAGVPHDLGVLSHYDTVLWYLGDNRLTQDAVGEFTDIQGDQVADVSVSLAARTLTLAMRDYLNEGGKLVYAGESAGYFGALGKTIGGVFYGLDADPSQPCVVTTSVDDCALLTDDFVQYYLGGFDRQSASASGVALELPSVERTVLFGGAAVEANPVDEAGVFVETSDVLDPAQFPQFRSEGVGDYLDASTAVFPIEGEWAAAAAHVDDGYLRLGRTFDLKDVADGTSARFEAQFDYDVEEGYDHVIVEARTVGADDWTTLPDLGGLSSTTVPSFCEEGSLLSEHPRLTNYLTLGDPCLPEGRTGGWNAFTGSSGGWKEVSFDLAAHAGSEVEVQISYVTDSFVGERGLVVDDTALVIAGVESEQEGFENGLGSWAALPEPEGSPDTDGSFERATRLGSVTAAVGTPDSVMLGFGLEQLDSDASRAEVVKGVLAYLRN